MHSPITTIKGRCRVDEITGCWVWTGSTAASNRGKTHTPRIYAPDYTLDPTGKTKTVQTGNRAAWHAHTGKPIPRGHLVFRLECCTNGMCVNPAHLRCGPADQWGKTIAAKGIFKGVRARIEANRAIGRKRTRVTPAMAQEIRLSDESGEALCTRLGLCRSTISKIRKGQFASVQAVGNPFAGLMRA